MEKGASTVPSEAESDLPRYEFGDMNAALPNGNGESSAHAAAPSSGGPESHDKKTSYALSLQKACDVAYQRVKNNNVIANTNWASPLATAPSAISTMAILLKAADKEAAAGLEIESQDVKDLEGTTIVGSLP
jgi:hypothetical protein